MSRQLREGPYWVRVFEGAEWQPAHHSGGQFFLIGVELPVAEVFEVGDELRPPIDAEPPVSLATLLKRTRSPE